MKVLGVIPARYGSTRFPGKPLALINGKSMINRVYHQAKACNKVSQLVVATDDDRIYNHVLEFGGQAVMTSPEHVNGTSRCLEVLDKQTEEYDLVVNIQGDEPYLQPQQIGELIDAMAVSAAPVGTLVKVINDIQELDNPNVVKVVRQHTGLALYFSRTMIPYCKPDQKLEVFNKGLFLKHVGVYAYRPRILRILPVLQTGSLEQAESLEQLRWLEQGVYIATALTAFDNHAVDIPSDVAKLESIYTD
jgi:3-deoxy-manno-octulosonate cytidylyltransferase (CMP-KDO synthetase)